MNERYTHSVATGASVESERASETGYEPGAESIEAERP